VKLVAVETTIEIECGAAACWDLLRDPLLVPEWVAGVAEAIVLTRDPDGQPVEVRFVGMPSTASIDYVLAYSYQPAERRLRWRTVGGDDRRLDGEAWLVALDGDRCRFHYRLQSWTADSLPRWARDTLADDTPDRVVRAFQRFAERRAAARPPP